jgi:hypothetical protein
VSIKEKKTPVPVFSLSGSFIRPGQSISRGILAGWLTHLPPSHALCTSHTGGTITSPATPWSLQDNRDINHHPFYVVASCVVPDKKLGANPKAMLLGFQAKKRRSLLVLHADCTVVVLNSLHI